MPNQVLDLSGGELDLIVVVGTEAEFSLAVLHPITKLALPIAPCTWSIAVVDDIGNPVVTMTAVTDPENVGVILIKITAEESERLEGGHDYRWQLIQHPTDTSYGPYAVASGRLHAEAQL